MHPSDEPPPHVYDEGPPPGLDMGPEDPRGPSRGGGSKGRKGDRPPARGPMGRVPPQDLDAERAVLGSVLLTNDSINVAVELLGPDDFYRPGHRMVYAAMTELSQKGEPVDAVTLSSHLKARDELDSAGGIEGIIALAETVATAANIKYYAEIVKKKSTLRKLIEAATQIVAEAYDTSDPDGAVDEAERQIFEIAKTKSKGGITPVSEIVVDAFQMIEKRADQRQAVTGVHTGITDLDHKTAGLQPSDLIIVAGRPSMGKTAFSIGMGLHAAVNTGKALAIFSLEMSKESLVMRMLCSEGRVDSARLRGGFLNEEDWPRLGRAAGRISEAPIFIDDTGAISVLEVRAKCRRLASEHGLDVIIIDYLQLMRGSPNSQSREQEISEISRGLKALAKELNVPVVALSQLNRGVEQRVDKRPGLSDLRESGAIEQDADVIMFVYRDEVYNPETEDRGISEIIVGKQRNGPIGTVRCRFFHEFTRFDNLTEEDRAAP
ncbi:MAG: replicative DNA helicase [Deltaproteobacteria bacterium]